MTKLWPALDDAFTLSAESVRNANIVSAGESKLVVTEQGGRIVVSVNPFSGG